MISIAEEMAREQERLLSGKVGCLYYVARRPKGQGKPPITEALSRHRSLEAANRAAKSMNRTGSDVQVCSLDI